MYKLNAKITILYSLFMPNHTYSMLVAIFGSIKHPLNSSRYYSEQKALELAKRALTDKLTSAGVTNFEVIPINRIFQSYVICAQKFCPYAKDDLDKLSKVFFKDDPSAKCLCTRRGEFDTIEHVIHVVQKKKPELK